MVAPSMASSSVSHRMSGWSDDHRRLSSVGGGGSSLGWKPRSATASPPRAQRGRNPQRDQPVEGDRADEQGARERLVPVGGDLDDHERTVDRVQEQRAERGAEHGAATAEDRDTADDDRSDHLELI